jgi:hypothetical protein
MPSPSLPTLDQVRAWLTARHWLAEKPGRHGRLWLPPGTGRPVGVPHDDESPHLIAGVIDRVADRMHMTADDVRREMLGTGPEEPDAEPDSGPVRDCKAIARALHDLDNGGEHPVSAVRAAIAARLTEAGRPGTAAILEQAAQALTAGSEAG